MEFKFRRFTIFSGIFLILIAFLDESKIELLIFSFFAGMIDGLFLDLVAHSFASPLWKYPRQPFKSRDYFLLVIPAWGVFSMQINFLWNFLRLWIRGEWIFSVSLTGAIITIILFLLYEIPNLKRKAWQYQWSLKKIIIGWPLLIIIFRLNYKILTVLI